MPTNLARLCRHLHEVAAAPERGAVLPRLASALASYRGRDWARTARWQRYRVLGAGRPDAAPTTPFPLTIYDVDRVRLRMLWWPPGADLGYHGHPGFEAVGLRVLDGSPLLEYRRGARPPLRELRAGDVSVLGGLAAHRVRVASELVGTATLQADLR